VLVKARLGIVAALAVLSLVPAAHAAKPLRQFKCRSVLACHADLARAYAAIDWLKHDRGVQVRKAQDAKGYGVNYAAKLAQATYGVPSGQILRVGSCESGLDPTQVTAGDASGWMQFLRSTWDHTAYGGFSIFDPIAQALAAARFVASHHGSWTASGGWAASYHCHHLR
jgi:hypothetical protein